MARLVLHFGGNGHASARLDRARVALAARCPGIELVDLAYPGFEGRPRAGSLDEFLDALAAQVRGLPGPPVGAFASGIGALIALGLRTRGELAGLPLVFEGPVLWGLEGRAFPRVMRAFPPARGLPRSALGLGVFQRRFAREHFESEPDPATLAGFFEGYRRCSAFGDFFDWFGPEYLRALERDFALNPEGLERITVWVGGRDRVVGLAEVRATERALQVHLPVVEFAGWGHYPMIDVPEEWADALCLSLAPAGSV